ncbi:MAG: hypothetical protein KC609_04990 [Myxococcales bacterium]|nr:hypothetical protein [Myxococcales bacterium]
MTLRDTFETAAARLGVPIQLEPHSAVEERLERTRRQADFSARNAALIALLVDYPYDPSVLVTALSSELFVDRPLEQALMAADALRLVVFPPDRDADRQALQALAQRACRLGLVERDAPFRGMLADRTALHASAYNDLQQRFAIVAPTSTTGALKQRVIESDRLTPDELEQLLEAAATEADVEALLLINAHSTRSELPSAATYARACSAILARADALLTAGLPAAANYLLLLLADLEDDDFAEAMIAESLLDAGDAAQASALIEETVDQRAGHAHETLVALRARAALALGDLEGAGRQLAPYLDLGEREADTLGAVHPQLVSAAVEYCLRVEIAHPVCQALPAVLRVHPGDRYANLLRCTIEFGLLRSHGLDDAAFLLFRQLLIDFPGYRRAWDFFREQLELADPPFSAIEAVIEAIVTQHLFALPVWRGIAELGSLPPSWRAAIGALIETCSQRQRV